MKFFKRNKSTEEPTEESEVAASGSQPEPLAAQEDVSDSASADQKQATERPDVEPVDAPSSPATADALPMPGESSAQSISTDCEAGRDTPAEKSPAALDPAQHDESVVAPAAEPGLFSRLKRSLSFGDGEPAAEATVPADSLPQVAATEGVESSASATEAVDAAAPESAATVDAPEPALTAVEHNDDVEVVPPEAAELKTESEPVPAPVPVENAAVEPEPATSSESVALENTGAEGEAGLFTRMKRGLSRTGDSLFQGLGNLFLGRKEIDAELLEELESRLLMADVGVDATVSIIESLTQRVSRKELTHPEALQAALREELLAILKPCQQPLEVSGKKPYVILMVGVNGVGKTTTIGKLAMRYKAEGRSVMLAAGDTFRAAAVEQLQVWGERNAVPVVAQHTGADSASVLFDALQAAQTRGVDVLIADTAGRLHNKDNLMEELKKVVRVMAKLDPDAPHEVMLVLDAGTGQNALAQASHFQQAVGVSGISLTKLDGTAKGGVIFAIAKKLQLPIRFIGVGEAAEDLRPFEAEQFIEALFSRVGPPA